jgi:hypothetical protein
MTITRKKLEAASPKWNCPVIMAAKAKRNTISEEASFKRLSPSTILFSDFGTFTPRIIVVAETASGGEIMPPKRKPNAKVNPGIMKLETNAITHEVMITMWKEKLMITLFHFQNCFHDISQAAS